MTFSQTDVDHFVAHSDMADSLKPLINILRDNVPMVKNGTIGEDIGLLVKTFGRGMEVQIRKVKPDLGVADEPDYGYCIAPIGTLDMDPALIAENLDAILEKLDENRPKRKDPKDNAFLTRCMIRVSGDDDPHSNFSVLRDTISDDKGRKQPEDVAVGKAMVEEKVKQIKSKAV